MTAFLVSYDAHKVRNYKDIHEAMKEFGAVKVLESLWIVDLDNTTIEVRDWVRSLMDDDDSIFVLRLKPKHAWASRNLKTGTGAKINGLIA